MANNEYLTTAEVAKLLGLSRVSIFNRIKKGEIIATRVGRGYLVSKVELERIVSHNHLPDKVVRRVVAEYGETLKLLGKE